MSSQKLRRRQTIQPTLNNKLLPTSLLNQLSTSDNNSRKSFDTNVSKDQSQSQQSETIPVQTSKKPSAQPRKSIQGVFPLQKKNSNVQQSTSDKQQGVLYGGDNTNSSVYDKYKQNFAKLLLQGLTGDKKTKDGEQGNDDQGGAGSNKLTPMPQLQKKGNTNNVNKDVFAKAERSAVVMRRMEYNAKLANRKTVRKSISKGPPLSKVKFLQKMMRGFLIRKKFINKAKYFRKMYKAVRLKHLAKHFEFFIKQTNLTKRKQTQIKTEIKIIPSPIIEETPSPPLKKEPPCPLKDNIQPFIPNIEKMFDNTSCQTSFIIEPEETPKEKYLDLISGGTSKSQNTRINGIKTFPRLKVELGNNEKLLKKMYKRLNKLRIDDIQIDTKQKLQFNLNTTNDNAVQSVVQKLLDLRLDTASSPKNTFKVNETQIASQHNEVSSFVVHGTNNTNKALAYVRSLIKFKVKHDKQMFITKRIYSNYQRQMKERRNMKIKLFIIVLSHLSSKQIRKYVLYVIKKKCCSHLTRNKSAFSVFSIEDEIDDFDEENIQNMKRNATIDMNPLRYRKTCCSTLSKECSNDNYVDDEINVDYIIGE